MAPKAVGRVALRQVVKDEIARCVFSQCGQDAGFWPIVYFRCDDGEDVYHLLRLPHCTVHQAVAAERGDPVRAVNWRKLSAEARLQGHGEIDPGSIQLGWSDKPFLACTVCSRTDGFHAPWCSGASVGRKNHEHA